ncbi:MAG: tyrosine recombinase [Ruminococcaceae bacterium]|nr:tyrosine recombinase [Oscillospiraceae bacterium]
MRAYIKEFEVYLATIKKASSNTLESYIRDLSQFACFCDSINLRSTTTAKKSDIESYVTSLQKSGKSAATATRVLASLRCYYGFLLSNSLVRANPVADIKLNKPQKKLPEILTSNEISKLLAQPDASDLKGCRDKAILELLYATGIKVSEIIGIKMSQINLQIGILHLSNEKSERIIPMYPDAVKALTNYCLNVRSVVVVDDSVDELFTNMNGQPLTRQGLWKIIKFYAEKAQIKKDINPHTIRHSFAAHLLENGAPLKDIQEILGHSDLSSTQIYAQLMRNRYAQSYKKYHPLAR